MDERLRDLLDHQEIRKVLSVYCQGSDRVDAERMASVFHSDSWVDHGDVHCPGPEFVDHALPQQAKLCSMVWHQLGQSIIEVTEDEATAETYVLVVLRGAGSDTAKLHFMGGRFLDAFRREAGQWKIKKRLQVSDWSYSQVVQEDYLAGAFLEGSQSGADPLFATFGISHSGKVSLKPA